MISEVGTRLKEARIKAGIYQEDAAKAAGMSRPTLSAVENGKRDASIDEIRKFSELYHVSVDYIITGSSATARLREYWKEIDKVTQEYREKLDEVMDKMKEDV